MPLSMDCLMNAISEDQRLRNQYSTSWIHTPAKCCALRGQDRDDPRLTSRGDCARRGANKKLMRSSFLFDHEMSPLVKKVTIEVPKF